MAAMMVIVVPFAGLGHLPRTEPPDKRHATIHGEGCADREQQDASAAEEGAGSTTQDAVKMKLADAIAAISEELGLPPGVSAKHVSKPITCLLTND